MSHRAHASSSSSKRAGTRSNLDGSVPRTRTSKVVGLVKYNLDNDDYIQFIRLVRQQIRNSPNDFEVIDVELRVPSDSGNLDKITGKISKGNVYLLGCQQFKDEGSQQVGGKLWEFGKSNTDPTERKLEGSSFLGFGENYKDLGDIDNIVVGYHPFRRAVRYLSRSKDVREDIERWKASLATIIVMVSEAVRFNWLLEEFAVLMAERKCKDKFTEYKLGTTPWMIDLIQSWDNLSAKINEYDLSVEGRKRNAEGYSPTKDEQYWKVLLARDVEKLSKEPKYAKGCVAIVLRTAQA